MSGATNFSTLSKQIQMNRKILVKSYQVALTENEMMAGSTLNYISTLQHLIPDPVNLLSVLLPSWCEVTELAQTIETLKETVEAQSRRIDD